jgi:hypothetical protein
MIPKPPPPPLVLSTPRKEPAPYKLPWVGKYTEEIANRICDEVAAGRTLERIAIEETWAPSARQIRFWMMEFKDFEDAYEMAVQIRADAYAFETIELADTAVDGVNTDSLRIQIGARQWLAGKLRPKYGEKKTVEATVASTVNVVGQIDVSHMTMEQIHMVELALRKTLGGSAAEDDEEEEET